MGDSTSFSSRKSLQMHNVASAKSTSGTPFLAFLREAGTPHMGGCNWKALHFLRNFLRKHQGNHCMETIGGRFRDELPDLVKQKKLHPV